MKNAKTKKFLMVASMLAVLGAVGVASSSVALADSRYININDSRRHVRHNGDGPYIRLNGHNYFLDTNHNDRSVVINGVRYKVHGRS
jgi:hypothetical protein